MSQGVGRNLSPEERTRQLDAQISRIQKSTRAFFPAMVPLHEIMRGKYHWYHQWSSFSVSKYVHLVVLLLYIAFGASWFSANFFQNPNQAHAATSTCTWSNNSTDGLWSTAANWSDCGHVPSIANDVVLNGTSNTPLTIDISASAASFTVSAGYTNTITANQNLGITTTQGGTGNFILSSGTYLANATSITVPGNFNITGGTFTAGTSTLRFVSEIVGNHTINPAGQIFNNVYFEGVYGYFGTDDKFQPTSSLDINGTFTLNTGTLDLDTFDPTLNIAGNIAINGESSDRGINNVTIIKSSSNALVTFDGNLQYNFSAWRIDVSAINFGDVVISNSATIRLDNPDIYFNFDSLTINSGSTINFTGSSLAVGDITIAVNANLISIDQYGRLFVSGNWVNYGNYSSGGAGTEFNGSSQTIVGSTHFGFLTVTNTHLTIDHNSTIYVDYFQDVYDHFNYELNMSNASLVSDSPGTPWKIILDPNITTSIIDTSVRDSDGSGGIRVDATTGVGNTNVSGNTNWYFGPPPPTIGTPETLSNSTIRWHFTDNSSDELGFKIYQSAINDDRYPYPSLIATCATPNITFCDSIGLSPNNRYSAYAVAYTSDGKSAPSADATGWTLPITPSVPSVSTISGQPTKLLIANLPDTNGYWSSSFVIQETQQSGGMYVQADGSLGPNYYSFNSKSVITINGLIANTSYTFQVQGSNSGGKTPFGPSASATTAPSAVVLAAPTNLSVSGITSSQTTLSWDASTSSVSGYNIYNAATGVRLANTTSLSRTLTGLNPSTTYQFYIRAYDSDGNTSGPSDTISATTLALPINTIISKIIPLVLPNLPDSPLANFLNSLVNENATKLNNTVVATTTAAIAVPLAVNAAFGLGSVIPQIVYWFTQLLQFLGLRKKRKNWGTIFNSQTGQGIGLATVKIYDKEYDKLLETAITDKDGRFGFLVKPGLYYLIVSKTGFTFPSKNLKSDFFDKVYLGGDIAISTAEEGLIDLNIALDSTVKTSVAQKAWVGLIKVSKFLQKIRIPLTLFGLSFSIIMIFKNYSLIYIYSIGFYLIFFLIELIQPKNTKPYGVVSDSEGNPLDIAIVRIFNKKNNHLVGTDVTDAQGRFKLLVNPGFYYITAAKPGYREYKTHALFLERKGSVVTSNVKLKKLVV